MVLSKLILRTVKKNISKALKNDDKFGHGNGNWSKTKDLLYFSFILKILEIDCILIETLLNWYLGFGFLKNLNPDPKTITILFPLILNRGNLIVLNERLGYFNLFFSESGSPDSARNFNLFSEKKARQTPESHGKPRCVR